VAKNERRWSRTGAIFGQIAVHLARTVGESFREKFPLMVRVQRLIRARRGGVDQGHHSGWRWRGALVLPAIVVIPLLAAGRTQETQENPGHSRAQETSGDSRAEPPDHRRDSDCHYTVPPEQKAVQDASYLAGTLSSLGNYRTCEEGESPILQAQSGLRRIDMSAGTARDPWGNTYWAECIPFGHSGIIETSVCSAGPDGIRHNADDICDWFHHRPRQPEETKPPRPAARGGKASPSPAGRR
jgi:hypothetical protein